MPGTGTGALNSRKIHVSISLISQAINDEICSVDIVPLEPVKIPHTVSRWLFESDVLDVDLPKLVDVFELEEFEEVGVPGLEANERAWHASIIRRRIFRHSRNIEKNGWWLIIHKVVRVCVYLTSLAFLPRRFFLAANWLSFWLLLLLLELFACCSSSVSSSFSLLFFCCLSASFLFFWRRRCVLWRFCSYFFSIGRKKFMHIPKRTRDESFSVSVNMKVVESLWAFAFAWLEQLIFMHPYFRMSSI